MATVGAFFGAVFFGTAATATLAYTIAVQIARMIILSAISKALAPKPNLAQTAADKMLTIRSSIQPQAFVYGQDMLSGPIIFGQVTGNGNKYLHRLIAITGRQIDSFVGFRIDDEDVDIPTDIPDANDTITGGKYADVVIIETQLGTSSQTALSQLTTDCSANWTSAHRCRGWSTFYTRMEIKGKNTAFKRGAPQNLRALVKGNLVYDPRLDSTRVIDSTTSPETYGTGSHRADDASTWAWSNNPALCLADFLMWGNDDVFGSDHMVGCGEDPSRIDWELVATAADICEEQVLIPPAGSPSTFQNRYTCNLTFYSNTQRGQVKEMLETAMLGRCIFSGGKWKMWAGAAIASTITLDETFLTGDGPSIEAGIGDKERYNLVRGKFVDPDRNYGANSYPDQTDAAYVTADNGTKAKVFDWNACNNSYEAQRNAIIMLRKSRQDLTIRWPGNWKCFQLQPGSVCTIDLDELSWSSSASPISSKKFFVTEWTLADDGSGVEIIGALEDDTVWADPAIGDYTTRTPTGELVPPGEADGALSDATISNTNLDATCYAGVKLGADGQVYYQRADGSWTTAGVPTDEWLGVGSGSYWCKCTILDSPQGTLDSGTVDSVLALSSDRSFSINQASEGTKTKQIYIEIYSDVLATTVIGAATFSLSAEYAASTVYLQDHEHTQTHATSATPSISFDYYGRLVVNTVDYVSSPDYHRYPGEWYIGQPVFNIGTDYECICSDISYAGGADDSRFSSSRGSDIGIDSWANINNLAFTLYRTSGLEGSGTSTVVFTLSIRDATTLEVLASSQITLNAVIS